MLSKQDRSFLNLAAKVAELSDCRIRHGSVLVRGGSVIAISPNVWRNHCKYTELDKIQSDCSVHSEVAVLKRAAETKNTVLYVARINKSGKVRFSKPCDSCQDAIEIAKVKRVVWSEDGEQ